MSELNNDIDELIDDEEDDDYFEEDDDYPYEGTLVEDDVWEDVLAYRGLRDRYPDTYILKVINFYGQKLEELDEWLKENIHSQYERIGWRSGCSYTVAVVFWDQVDAVLYRMRWQ